MKKTKKLNQLVNLGQNNSWKFGFMSTYIVSKLVVGYGEQVNFDCM